MTNKLEILLTRLVAGFSFDVGGRNLTIPLPPAGAAGTPPPLDGLGPGTAGAGKVRLFDMDGIPVSPVEENDRREAVVEVDSERECVVYLGAFSPPPPAIDGPSVPVPAPVRVICRDERDGAAAVESRLVRDDAEADWEPLLLWDLVGKNCNCDAGMRTISRTRCVGTFSAVVVVLVDGCVMIDNDVVGRSIVRESLGIKEDAWDCDSPTFFELSLLEVDPIGK